MNGDSPVAYRIYPRNPGAHLFEVSCTVADPEVQGQKFSLPTWIPGSYLIREFARNVVRLRAESAGAQILVTKLSKDTWQCAPCTGPLTVTYEVYAWDLSVRGAHLDTTHGYFNGSCVFLWPHGREHRPCVLEILRPAGVAYARWRIATAMPRREAELYGFGSYQTQDYDELIDHPVEMGEFALANFEACGVTHDVVVCGRQRGDLERLCRDLKLLCEYHIRFFGTPVPMERYVFLIRAVGEGYGGLEHRASTSLLCNRDHLPRPQETKISKGYRSLLGLASHEYFHAWNVKRIRPAAFTPLDLQRENYTRLLWAFEGVTSYYDDLALLRCGLINLDEYLDLLSETATRVWRGSGRRKQSVAESSFDAWIKFYRPDENTPNAVVSYYAKGALIALALDLTIRRGTEDKKSLDDVMRALWTRYGKTGTGVPEDGIERLVDEVSGLQLHAFFEQALHGTEDLPLQELLASFGVAFAARPAVSADDVGGKPKLETGAPARAVLGARFSPEGTDAKIVQVFDDGAAQTAGLAAGDVVAAIDGVRATSANIEKLLAQYAPGVAVRLHVFRRDELMEFHATLAAPPADTCMFTSMDKIDPIVRRRRESWLHKA